MGAFRELGLELRFIRRSLTDKKSPERVARDFCYVGFVEREAKKSLFGGLEPFSSEKGSKTEAKRPLKAKPSNPKKRTIFQSNLSQTNLKFSFTTIANFFDERQKNRKSHFTNLTLTGKLGVLAPSFSLIQGLVYGRDFGVCRVLPLELLCGRCGRFFGRRTRKITWGTPLGVFPKPLSSGGKTLVFPPDPL